MNPERALRLALNFLKPLQEAGRIYEGYLQDEGIDDEQYGEMLVALETMAEDAKGNCNRCGSPLTGTYDAEQPANNRGPGYCSEQTCPHNDHLQHETWTEE